jgi:uncharacterized integral membrane protein
VKLDAYKSCSFSEKRQVLETFWRARPAQSTKVASAATQYGPWAVALLVIIMLELVVLLIATVSLGYPAGWFALIPGALAAFGLVKAVERSRALGTPTEQAA